MEELNLFEEKIIEVGGKTEYYILKQIIHNGKMYLFGNELADEDTPTENMAILKVEPVEDDVLISLESDESLINELLVKFSELLGEN